ncbi:sulfurtransferase complex subunit TusC [Alteromonas facilis]|uniref:sulfurtransferase complex subunit TusC n=1 Tax=Alteromonas facilis TaxID=2048004 RepID=UPI000C28A5E4|nr:sulfurtransferase complex subunit TusC [Alteromonas facilis]
MATILSIISQAPHQTTESKDALDFAMAAGGYGHSCDVLLINDGVFHVLTAATQDVFKTKDAKKRLKSLNFFDVEHVYICEQSLTQRCVNFINDIEGAEILDTNQLSALTDQYDFVVSF